MRYLPVIMLLALAACHPRNHYPPGGYPYPEPGTVKDTNFYFYPVRNALSRQDSLFDAMAYPSFRDLDEPNLSLQPMPEDVFRLSYQSALHGGPIMIILTKDSIVVKHGRRTELLANGPDTLALSPLERLLVTILDRDYPLDDRQRRRNVWRQRYLDSIGRLYPQLYSPAYYKSLMDKEYPYHEILFSYTRQSKKITIKEFDHLVQGINASGYWKLPVNVPCSSTPMDGYGYTLEANTRTRYNVVISTSCEITTDLDRACEELVRYAGLDKEIRLAFDQKVDTAR